MKHFKNYFLFVLLCALTNNISAMKIPTKTLQKELLKEIQKEKKQDALAAKQDTHSFQRPVIFPEEVGINGVDIFLKKKPPILQKYDDYAHRLRNAPPMPQKNQNYNKRQCIRPGATWKKSWKKSTFQPIGPFMLLDSAEQQLLARQPLGKELLEQELLEKQFLRQQFLERQLLAQQALEKKLLEQELLEQQYLEQKLLEQQYLEQELLEQQYLEQELLEQQSLEQELLEQESLERQLLAQQSLKQKNRPRTIIKYFV